MSDRHKWDSRYRQSPGTPATPCPLLEQFSHLLPPRGRALDLAAGRGGNALHLARHGLDTDAWDLSAVATAALDQHAKAEGLSLSAHCRDVIAEPPAPASFDVIVVSRFLHRPLCPSLARALRPAGLLFYQTFTREKCNPDTGPGNPAYLLERNELLQLFPDLTLLVYREEGLTGDCRSGVRNEAWLIAMQGDDDRL